MRFQRLIPDPVSGEPSALVFHPRLTVLAGLDRDDRRAVAAALLEALAGSRRDTRLDLLDDTGRHLSVRRASSPDGDKVLNLDNAQEVSLEFLNGGNVDLLHRLGLDAARAARRCRLGADDMDALRRGETLVASLATRDQERLWAAAERLRDAERALERLAGTATDDPERVALFDAVERTHAQCHRARARYRTVRRRSLLAGLPAAAALAPAVMLAWPAALPLGAVAGAGTLLSVAARVRARRAAADERGQLAAAGGGSYVDFRLDRLTARLDRLEGGAGVRVAAGECDEARAAWTAIAGGASVDAAFSLRDRITAAAERLADGGRLPSPGEGAGLGEASPADLAEALMIRMADLRQLGPEGVSVPLLLDEPLAGVDLPVKEWMLELIARTAGSPQIVYLTGDPDVAAWAGIEALTGQLTLAAAGRRAFQVG